MIYLCLCLVTATETCSNHQIQYLSSRLSTILDWNRIFCAGSMLILSYRVLKHAQRLLIYLSQPLKNPSSVMSWRLRVSGEFSSPYGRKSGKFDTLCDLFASPTITQSVIFCNRRRKVRLSYHRMVFFPANTRTRWTGSQKRYAQQISPYPSCMAKCRIENGMP